MGRQNLAKATIAEPEKQCSESFLMAPEDPYVISHWISLFISETRLVDGSQYPPKTLY